MASRRSLSAFKLYRKDAWVHRNTPEPIRTYRKLLRIVSTFPSVHHRAYFAFTIRDIYEAHKDDHMKAEELLKDAQLDIAFLSRLAQVANDDSELREMMQRISNFVKSEKNLNLALVYRRKLSGEPVKASTRKCMWLPTSNMDIEF